MNEDIWKVLHIRSRQLKTSISELVRQAVREKYGSASVGRRQAMQSLVGMFGGMMGMMGGGGGGVQ